MTRFKNLLLTAVLLLAPSLAGASSLPSSIAAQDSNGPVGLAAGVDASGHKFQGTTLLGGDGFPLFPDNTFVPALDGTDGSGITAPAGGAGIRGWLSGIYRTVNNPLTVGGTISVTNLPSTQAISASALPLPAGAATSTAQTAAQTSLTSIAANTAAVPGLGAIALVPAGTTNGTPLGSLPTGARGARLYLPTGTAITFTIASAQPGSAPSAVFTITAATTGPNWDEALAGGQMIYVTATTGAPLFRWN